MGTGTLVHSLGSMNLSPMIFELYNAMFRNSDVYINIVKIMSEHHSGMTRSELSDAVGISGGTLTSILQLRALRLYRAYKQLRMQVKGHDVLSWKKKADAGHRGAQVDLVIERADRIIHLCEMNNTL